MRRLVLLLALAAAASAAQPAPPGVALRFERLGAAEGLSQSSVLAMLQDRRGFLWLGTQDGLNRYDGTGVTVYRHDPLDEASLPTAYVQTLAESRDGALWVGTWGGGLSRFDPAAETFIHFRHDPDDPASLPDDIVTAVLEDAAGRLWVGTAGGLARLDRDTGRFRPVRAGLLPDAFVWSLSEAAPGTLWVGLYRAGAVRLDLASGTAKAFRHDPADPATIPSDEAATVAVADGRVWIGTGDGLAALEGGAIRRLTEDDGLCGSSIYDLALDGGALWVATGDGGLCRVRADGRLDAYRNRPADALSLPADVVRSLLVDRTGTLWVGTDGGGAARSTGASERFGLYRPDALDPDALPHPYVWSFAETPDRALWVGTDGGGLARLDRETGRFETRTTAEGLVSDVVVALEPSAAGGLWVGTFEGLDRLLPDGRIEAEPSAPEGRSALVTALHEAPDGTLWIGTWGDGLGQRAPDGTLTHLMHEQADPTSLPNDVISAIGPAAGGRLWIGTYGSGVARLDPATGRFEAFREAPEGPLSGGTVYAVREAGGAVWIATAGGGLNRLDPATGDVRVLTTRDGLPHNIVYALAEDARGRLWLSTNDGVAVLDPATGEVSASYDAADGLQGNEFNSGAALALADGSLAFGGTQGINVFHPDRIGREAPPPPVALTGVRRFDEPVDLGVAAPYATSVRVSHRDNFLTFEFAALDFTDPEGTRYRYRLDGVDEAWRETDGRRPTASYTDLPGGHYDFRVQALGADGAWSDGAVLSVDVIPPWWGTGWARALGLLLAVGLVAGGGVAVQRRRRAAAERERADEREAQRRLAAAREAERLRTARELHDGPLQDLYGARYRLEALGDALDAASGDGAPPLPALRTQAESVRETLLGASRQLRDVCAELRPPVLGPMGLGRALRTMAARIGDGRPETIRVEVEDAAPELSDGARVALYRVAQEAVRNALRHAEAETVTIRLGRGDRETVLTVRDDGRGFTPPRRLAELARQDHLGLVGAAERVAAVGGRLTVDAAPGRGTTLTAAVPFADRPADAPAAPASDPIPQP